VKILYSAIDQTVPGTTGGSVHVQAVAEGLAALQHDVHVLVTPGNGPFPDGHVRWIPLTPPLGARPLRWLRTRAVTDIATRLKPDVVIERYYNFGGEGISAAASVGAKAVLEVNAPVVDHPRIAEGLDRSSARCRTDARWRERLCERADLIVTPSAAILPPDTPARKIVRLEWGADTDRFTPDAAGPLPFERPGATVAIFAGAFRSWHGAVNLVRAIRELHARGRTDIGAVLIGDGPEQRTVRAEAHGLTNVVIPGAVPHADVPACLRRAISGSRCSTWPRTAAGARLFLVAVEDLHGDRAACRSASGRSHPVARRERPRGTARSGALRRAGIVNRAADGSEIRRRGCAPASAPFASIQLEGTLRSARPRDPRVAPVAPGTVAPGTPASGTSAIWHAAP
jgi:hypothetical protein